MTMTAERQMELTLPMVADIEIAAARAAGNLAREMGMSAGRIDEMAHAIIEACINAREHACCADQRIYLRFVGSYRGDGNPRIDVWITDHGRGFDPSEARSRRRKLGPAYKRGRGIQLMEAHMDEVEIISGDAGTTIHMVKYEKSGDEKKS
ncbi:MAG TPA: ATP-binding protein [Thermoanaerobaculia bacterium]|nr:ATP-binding protein [Thermoanaerobaculia bacterium]